MGLAPIPNERVIVSNRRGPLGALGCGVLLERLQFIGQMLEDIVDTFACQRISKRTVAVGAVLRAVALSPAV